MPFPWRSIRTPNPYRSEAWPPTATQLLIAANAGGFLVQWLLAGGFRVIGASGTPTSAAVRDFGALSLAGVQAGRLWEPLSCLFLHESALSLLMGLATLYFAGRNLESVVGRRHLFAIYGSGGLLGTAAQLWFHDSDQRTAAAMGASSAVIAVFVAFACAMPELEVTPLLATARTVRPRGVRVKHVAIGTGLAVAVLLVLDPGGRMRGQTDLSGWMTGCLVGAVYMRQLGFRRFVDSRGESVSAEPDALSTWSASGGMAATLPAGAPVSSSSLAEVTTMPATTGELVVAQFTERERRMSVREYMTERVDPILDKVLLHGLASLTDDERRVLEKGREKMQNTRFKQ